MNDWVDEQRKRAEEDERVLASAAEENKRPVRSAPRKGQTAAERLREKLKQKQPTAAAPPNALPISPPATSASSASSPIANPPFPHCLAVSPLTHSITVGLGNGQLAFLASLPELSPLSQPHPLVVQVLPAAVLCWLMVTVQRLCRSPGLVAV